MPNSLKKTGMFLVSIEHFYSGDLDLKKPEGGFRILMENSINNFTSILEIEGVKRLYAMVTEQ